MNFRPTRMEVDLENLKHNFLQVKGLVKEQSQVIGVVKANGYGMGMLEVARTLVDAGCSRLAVAIPDEAITLREKGISVPLLVLGPSPIIAAEEYVQKDIAATITDLSFAETLSKVAIDLGKVARVHLKVDTGMGRIGFLPEEVPDVVEKLLSMKGLELEGIFTHFATADERNREYTQLQFRRFCDVLDVLRTKNVRFRIRHCCNSAGTLNFPQMHMDAVRPGIILYGMWPSEWCRKEIELKRVFKVVTEVACVRTLPQGSGISYGLRYMTRGNDRIAILPIGYHDGYARSFSMKAEVLIKGKRAPILGSICMDQTMVDVTHIPDVKVGDEVVLIGQQSDEEITPEEMAKHLGTINYEIPNLFTPRVPRIYV
ncbi:alanine racemase [Thermovirga sp.]|uniref:alanine racemase n=1 Tax=Thermovirga sp. TaxID=2699834 RepID=UPI0025DB2255|nr:alanine racemase [Thermovirga sp.]MBO8153387.1 alanine racemase [Thermovirga sp.]